jgi:hypothetical protein
MGPVCASIGEHNVSGVDCERGSRCPPPTAPSEALEEGGGEERGLEMDDEGGDAKSSLRRYSATYLQRHTSGYVRIRQDTSAYVSIRQRRSRKWRSAVCAATAPDTERGIRQHTSAYVSMHQHTSAYGTAPHTLANSGARALREPCQSGRGAAYAPRRDS